VARKDKHAYMDIFFSDSQMEFNYVLVLEPVIPPVDILVIE